jgi:hypothetical protein
VPARSLLALVLILGTPAVTWAQAPRRCAADAYTRLDFWLGTWEVRLADGTLAGTDVVEKTLDGCVVRERWSDARGSQGESLFYYRATDRTWNQVWTTASGEVKEKIMVDAPQPHAVRFVGRAILADGRAVPDRTTLVAQADGTVRQVIEQSRDDGTWHVVFDARYERPAAAAAQAAAPGCDTAEHRQFDFWIGEWEVMTPDGKPAGRNAITAEMNGCVVHERWSGAGGMKGESFNIWDRVSKRWHQTWVNDRGNLLLLDGSFQNGVMQMSGMSGPPGQRVTNRITWSRSPDGIRQLWEVSSDGGTTWKTAFDGRYRPVKR